MAEYAVKVLKDAQAPIKIGKKGSRRVVVRTYPVKVYSKKQV